ncbi:hypothetical protein M3Y97_00493700 [Aphelenchoides bicaudatus]|nr:hypothetical protein M3Y97_00493700 [Aphelenchoides bicaudatus]
MSVEILSAEAWPNWGEKKPKTMSTKFSIRCGFIFFYFMASFMILMQFMLVFTWYFPSMSFLKIMDHSMFEAFGSDFIVLGFLFCGHGNFVWLIILIFYMFVLGQINEHLNSFNEDISEIGSESADPESLARELQVYYDRLSNLTSLIRNANNIFEVYVFVMLMLNVPIIIFSLITYPAKIYSSIHSIESIIYANKRIWSSYNEKVYRLANTLIGHAKQDGLGITIWQFSIIHKGVLLTTGSLILTYVILIEQMNSDENGSAWNGTHVNI